MIIKKGDFVTIKSNRIRREDDINPNIFYEVHTVGVTVFTLVVGGLYNMSDINKIKTVMQMPGDTNPPRVTIKQEKTNRLLTLPTDSAQRKNYPVLSGFLKYFPAAIAGAANTSKLGNDKHNPGEPLHHARGKSMDHGDCIVRHLMDVEDLLSARSKGDNEVSDESILIEANQMVWRALAYSQELHEKLGAPLAPSAKIENQKGEGK